MKNALHKMYANENLRKENVCSITNECMRREYCIVTLNVVSCGHVSSHCTVDHNEEVSKTRGEIPLS